MKYDPVNAHCPICGKFFVTMWKDFYVYRRGSTFYCSENCMLVDLTRDMKLISQVNDKRRINVMQKITLEQKKKAVEIAISGKSPLEYLKKCGSKAPDKTWWAIKAALKEKDPETYAKIPDFRKQASPEMIQENAELAEQVMEHIKEHPPTVKLTGPIKIETPEANKAEVIVTPEAPVNRYDDFTVQAIKGDYGRYSRSSCSGTEYIDFTSNNGEELTMPISAWRDFLDELHRAAKVLEVDL